MQFVKLTSDIPPCCRLRMAVPELNAEHYLEQLPDTADNAHRSNRRRFKWMLRRPGTGDTALLRSWPAMAAFLADFPGDCQFAHISMMEPQAKLGIHRDGFDPGGAKSEHHELFNSTLRFHVPLRTNERVHVYSDGRLYRMAQGELWMLDNMKTHAVVNDDTQSRRFHLIFDVRPDAALLAAIAEADAGLGLGDTEAIERFWPEMKAA